MQTKTITYGSTGFTIGELNTAQVRELIEFGKTEHSAEEWDARKWRTVALAVNNAKAAPTKENPIGSADGVEDLEASLGFVSSQQLHAAVLELSGLRPVTTGEQQAAA